MLPFFVGLFGGGMFGFGCAAILLAWRADDEHTGIAVAALGVAYLLASAWFLGAGVG